MTVNFRPGLRLKFCFCLLWQNIPYKSPLTNTQLILALYYTCTYILLHRRTIITELLSLQTLLVKNKEGFNNLPPLPGMLSYREDNEKLYVSKGNKWDAIGSEQEASIHVSTISLSFMITWSDERNKISNERNKLRIVNSIIHYKTNF